MSKKAKLALRTAINNAYSFVISSELNKGINSVTFDMLLQDELIRLKDGKTNKPSVLQRLEALEETVHNAIEEIKKIDPSEFSFLSEDEKTNS